MGTYKAGNLAMAFVLRKNAVLGRRLGAAGVRFLAHVTGAPERLLPHVDAVQWKETDWEEPGAHFVDSARRAIRVVIAVGDKDDGKAIEGYVVRRIVRLRTGDDLRTLDRQEHQICDRIAKRASAVIRLDVIGLESLLAIQAAFDEQIVADTLANDHSSPDVMPRLLYWLHQLAQQTYENRSLAFACVVSPRAVPGEFPRFPDDFLELKRYRVLSDGFRTAYSIGSDGHLLGLTDLATRKGNLSARHWFPEWCGDLARASATECCALALNRQGDLLVIERGTLRFTYRFGRWQYWNHSHLIHVLESLCRRQRVPRQKVRSVVAAVYRAALDASFRRSGALFVILAHKKHLGALVRKGDGIDDDERDDRHWVFDTTLPSRNIGTLSRAVLAELASLDGAVVLDGNGAIRAYGAVLNTTKSRRTRPAEGARTKAAIAASRFGVALKVSADGGISAFAAGHEVFSV